MSEQTLWLEVKPDSRETEATLEFILLSCKEAQSWAMTKVGSTETLFKAFNEIGSNELTLTVVPKEALLAAIDAGVRGNPFNNRFRVAPRKNWVKASHHRKRMTWEEYLSGEASPSAISNTLAPEQAVRDLYEKGLIRFQWGTLRLVKSYLLKISRFLVKHDIEPEEILRRLTSVKFHYISRLDQWKMGLTVNKD